MTRKREVKQPRKRKPRSVIVDGVARDVTTAEAVALALAGSEVTFDVEDQRAFQSEANRQGGVSVVRANSTRYRMTRRSERRKSYRRNLPAPIVATIDGQEVHKEPRWLARAACDGHTVTGTDKGDIERLEASNAVKGSRLVVAETPDGWALETRMPAKQTLKRNEDMKRMTEFPTWARGVTRQGPWRIGPETMGSVVDVRGVRG